MPDAPNRIREARKARGMTLEELAPRMQMSWSELAKIERDERPLTTEHLRRAARALECSAVALLPRDLVPDEVFEVAAIHARLLREDRDLLLTLARKLCGPHRPVARDVFDSLEDADEHDFPLDATIGVRSHSAGMLFYKLMEAEDGQRFWRLTGEKG